mgnify:FL=1
MEAETASPATDKAPAPNGKRTVQSYVAEVKLYDKEAQGWHERGKRIIRRYKDKRSPRDGNSNRFNMLWSNTQTLLPALYAKPAKPDIERRFKDADPLGRVSADVLERCTSYFIALDKTHLANRQCVFDYLLPGRGTAWVRYVPHFRDMDLTGSEEVRGEGPQTSDDADTGDALPKQEVYYEECVTDYVHWQDFGHNVARTWEEVWCGWRRVFLAKDELHERFDETYTKAKVALIPLDHVSKDLNDAKIAETQAKATIYELWDKRDRKVRWFHKDLNEFLDERDDPLELEDFFPFPRPLLTNLANDSLIPTPDYAQYQDQAQEIDELTARIASITKAIKVAGVYDASVQGLTRLLAEGVENQLFPVENWAIFAEKGGIDGAVSFLPIREITEALIALYQAREKVKQDLYEITGLSDILRGASNAQETATAQQIKSNFATLRLSDRQAEVQRFTRDLVRIVAQIIGKQFSIDTIKQISGVRLFDNLQQKQAIQSGQVPPPPGIKQDTLATMLEDPTWEEVEALIRDNCVRSFRIDIETDSIIKGDQQQDRQDATEFLTAAGGFLQQAVQAGQQQPDMIPLLAQMLMFGVRRFPIGKELESAFNVTLRKLEQAAAQPRPPQQSPDAIKAQAQAQLDQQKFNADQQQAHAKIQNDNAQASNKMASDERVAVQKAQYERELQELKMRGEWALRQMEIEASQRMKAYELGMIAQAETAKHEMSLRAQHDLGLQKER